MRALHEVLDDLWAATRHLLDDATQLHPSDFSQPSLLPGWTRAHVLAHLAHNADGGARLLTGVRTRTPGFEYESVTERAAAIEQGALQPPAATMAHLRNAAQRFRDACLAMRSHDWELAVTWTTGHQTSADTVPRSRLTEVLVHHVDLDVGYAPTAWPRAFVRERLDGVVGALNRGAHSPESLRLVAADSGRSLHLLGATSADPRTVTGAEGQLLVWLLGRSDGADLQVSDGRPLPVLPSTYAT